MISLGLDVSTQSITAAAIDLESKQVVYRKSIDYRSDPRLNRFGLNEDYIFPPSEPGEAFQPAAIFAAALDAALEDIKVEWLDLGLCPADISVVNCSAQQHAHLMLDEKADQCFKKLHCRETFSDEDLSNLVERSLALPFARIWRTSNTAKQARLVRERAGGRKEVIKISGSDAPLRFSAFGIMKTAEDYPEAYVRTAKIVQLNSLIAALLAGNPEVPLDFGNACGTSLIDYRAKAWSETLLEAVARDLEGGSRALRKKLPELASGTTIAGSIACYHSKKYGLPADCLVGIGSGDNPQTKVLVDDSLLSLGTSFVIMAKTDGTLVDMSGSTNAMYDALDRPFVFGCRTNSALRWDGVRVLHGLNRLDYARSDEALRAVPPGNKGRIFLWQPEEESFPVSGKIEPTRIDYSAPDFETDYAGIIESTLAAVYLHSRKFMADSDRIFVTGGPAASTEILKRVAAIWNRTVIPLDIGGAALGAAVSGAYALLKAEGRAPETDEWISRFVKTQKPVTPDEEAVRAYHADDGYLKRFEQVGL